MKNFLIATTLLANSFLAYGNSKLSAEEHAKQAMIQMQESQNKFGGGIVTVGNEVTCDFRVGTERIQNAIDSGAAEIRIADDTYTENLVIDDISIIIKGGYDNCADAANDISNNTRQIINGNGNVAPTVLITGSTQRNAVSLVSLALINGEGSDFSPGGGVSTVAADLELNLNRVSLTGNTSNFGGGLAIFTGDTDITLTDPLIANNSAQGGGGIYCTGSDASIFITDNGNAATGIFNNTATDGDGGAVLVESDCLFTTISGKEVGAFDVRGIFTNSATGNGGGIAARSGATVNLFGAPFCIFSCIGNNENPVNVNDNTADSNNDQDGLGGGVYATGAGTSVNVTNSLIEGNSAQAGGGIAVENEATLTMQSLYLFGTCWSPGSCNQVIENTTATSSGTIRGGGAYITNGASADISRTLFNGNRSDFGTAIYVTSEAAPATRSSLDLEGSLIVYNGEGGADGWSDTNAIRIRQSDAKIDFTTIADNDVASAAISNRSDGSLDIYSTIIHQSNGVDAYDDFGAVTLNIDCIMANEIASLPTPGAFQVIVEDDPEFIDRINGDFHLDAATSPGIDFCDTFGSTPDFNDSDNEPRGFDDPLASNNLGPYDIGYDETYANDIIFVNGFEDLGGGI